jgi:hypothetical protein
MLKAGCALLSRPTGSGYLPGRKQPGTPAAAEIRRRHHRLKKPVSLRQIYHPTPIALLSLEPSPRPSGFPSPFSRISRSLEWPRGLWTEVFDHQSRITGSCTLIKGFLS